MQQSEHKAEFIMGYRSNGLPVDRYPCLNIYRHLKHLKVDYGKVSLSFTRY